MMRKALVVLLVAFALAATCGARASTATIYSCTVTFPDVHYGVIFVSKESSHVRAGCRAFASASGSTLRFGVHQPGSWIIVAQYANVSLNMGALLIAPPRMANIIFRVANKPLFISHGWLLVKRGS